jgi:hypothetical protein
VIEPGGSGYATKRNEGLATASLVTGIASMLCCGLFTGILAIVMGVVSRRRIAASAGTLGGRGLATAGVALGIAGSVVWTSITIFAILFFLTLGHPPTRAAIPCDLLEHTVYHYHVALQIIDGGEQVPIPTDVGRPGPCYYWLHMHASSPGVIHVESPDQRTFTLGDFFDVWAITSTQTIRLDSGHVGAISLTPGQTLVVFVDGQRYTPDPRSIPLAEHEVIQIEISPPTIDPPPAYTFLPGL